MDVDWPQMSLSLKVLGNEMRHERWHGLDEMAATAAKWRPTKALQRLLSGEEVPVALLLPRCLLITRFYWALVDLTGLYWVILGYTGLYWVILGYTGLDWI